jgi:threonine synthase
MLYVTTKQRCNPVTAYKPLVSDTGEDGGCYLPFHIESLHWAESMEELTFSQAVANVLNYFFSANFSAWDIESCIGRSTCRITSLSGKILVAETWHNPGFSYGYITDCLYASLCKEQKIKGRATFWARIAVRTAIIFGLYADAIRSNYIRSDEAIDLAFSSDDFTDLIASYYCRLLGLPVGVILCGNQTDVVWDLLHRGVFNPQLSASQIRLGAETFLSVVCDLDVTGEDTIKLDSEALSELKKVISASVISAGRISAVINSVFRTDSYIIDTNTAAAYGSVQDYRAKSRAGNATLLFADCIPSAQGDLIKKATGITDSMLSEYCQ